jgi:Ni2+-binding GTPase involved in maturation of urease and hydrogenase
VAALCLAMREAAEELESRLGPLHLLIIESGGDNLTATFSRGLVDARHRDSKAARQHY